MWIAPLPSDDASMDVPFGAKVLRTDRERTCVAMNDGIEVWVQNKQVLKTMHISSRDGVNNMIMLGGEEIFATICYFSSTQRLIEIKSEPFLNTIIFSRSPRIRYS